MLYRGFQGNFSVTFFHCLCVGGFICGVNVVVLLVPCLVNVTFSRYLHLEF